MSWGERSCKRPCRRPDECDMGTCNVTCKGYEWDGVTPPDSERPATIEKPKPKKLSLGAATAITMAAGMGAFDNLPVPKERRVKKCLVCGKEHTHNNSFCSAECCKKYKPPTVNGKGE